VEALNDIPGQTCSPGVSRAQMRSPAFTWVEEMQMRSGVVRDEIGGGKWKMPSRYFPREIANGFKLKYPFNYS